MALPTVTRRKPVTSIRNPFAPRGDRWQYLYAFDEDSGTALINLGYAGTSYNAALVDGGGTISWEADADEQSDEASPPNNVVRTDGAASYVSLTMPTAATPSRFTILLRFKHVDATVSNLDVPFNSGQASGNAETLQVSMPADTDVIRVLYTDIDFVIHQFNWDRTDTIDGKHTIIMTGGELGFYAWLDGTAPESYAINGTPTTVPEYMDESLPTSGLDIGAGAEMFLGKATSGSHGAFDFYEYGFADVQLLEEHVMDCFADPYVVIRSATDVADLQDFVIPKVWNLTGTTGTVSANVVASPSAQTGIKLYYSTNRIMHDGATIGFSGTDVSAGGEQLRSLITGLTADTQYYCYAVMHTAGTPNREHILPGGIFTFKTRGTTDARFCVFGDSHFNVAAVTATSPTNSTIQGKDIVDNAVHPGRMAFWRMCMDIKINAPGIAGGPIDATFAMGDDAHADASAVNGADPDDGTGFETQFVNYRNQAAMIFATGEYFQVVGNHEGESNWQRQKNNSDDVYMQKWATIFRKKYLPQISNDVGAAFDAQWIAGQSGGDSGSEDWVQGSGGSENAAPIQSFFNVAIGNAELFILDVNRMTGDEDPDDPSAGAHARPSAEWEFGSVQKAWLAEKLAASTAKWKFLLFHNLPGGENIGITLGTAYYGRGSGWSLSSVDELWLLAQCKSNNATAIIKAHDHKFCHVKNSTVNIITCPTASAQSLMNSGWNWAEMDASYGDAFGEGSGNALVRKMFNAFGYLIFECTDTKCQVWVRNTWMSCGMGNYYNNLSYGLHEHWLTPSIITGSAGNPAVLSERPWQVFCAIEGQEYVDGFWGNGLVGEYAASTIDGAPVFDGTYSVVTSADDMFLPTMVGGTVYLDGTAYVIFEYGTAKVVAVVGDASSESGDIIIPADDYHTKIGPEPWEGCYRSSSILIEDTTDTQVAVAHIPRTLTSFELQNASTMQILVGGY